jgi:hypothetical protein
MVLSQDAVTRNHVVSDMTHDCSFSAPSKCVKAPPRKDGPTACPMKTSRIPWLPPMGPAYKPKSGCLSSWRVKQWMDLCMQDSSKHRDGGCRRESEKSQVSDWQTILIPNVRLLAFHKKKCTHTHVRDRYLKYLGGVNCLLCNTQVALILHIRMMRSAVADGCDIETTGPRNKSSKRNIATEMRYAVLTSWCKQQICEQDFGSSVTK